MECNTRFFGGVFGRGHGDGMMLSLQGYGNRTFWYSEMVEFRSEDEVRLDIWLRDCFGMQSNTDDIDMQPSDLKIQCVKYIAGFFQLFQKSW